MFPWLKSLFAEFTPRAGKATITLIAVVGFAGFVFGSSTVPGQKFEVTKSNQVSKSEPVKPKLFVHIIGSVKSPGIYQLDTGSRVYDAVLAAGGLTAKANQQSINLARGLTDGEQVVVFSQSQSVATQQGFQAQPQLLSLNQATASQLEDLPGVGPALAGRMIDWRLANGGFKSKDDLLNVSGIGDKLFSGLKDLVTL
ncbi:MAG: competence protein ComEA [Micrococcales bacterium]|nr:competence protein ComEA [Micrococcales bacterium]NBR78195.1 competence protein ComEA [Microbacteriaceae bacterium]